MKKLIALLMIVVMMFSCVALCMAAADALYDVNHDGRTGADDARAVLRCAVGLDSATPELLSIADTDSDGKLTAADARTVLRYAVGLSEEGVKGKYALDSLIIKVKSEYVVDDAFEIALLYNKKVKKYEFLFKDTDGGVYFTVYLKFPSKNNLYSLKEYYEELDCVEGVEFNYIAHIGQ